MKSKMVIVREGKCFTKGPCKTHLALMQEAQRMPAAGDVDLTPAIRIAEPHLMRIVALKLADHRPP